MATLNYSLYDCFTQEAFQGHVAAIVEVEQKPELSFAAKIAAELCQTITCFVWHEDDCIWVKSIAKDGSVWSINHGLLAVARHLLGPKGECDLHTYGGVYHSKANGNMITITLPKVLLNDAEMPDRLGQAFDIMPVSVRDMGKTCVVELRTVEDVLNLDPDINRISRLDYDRVVLTAEDDTVPFDYVCRYFSPKHYINENSGSLYIQTFLPMFWQERLGKDSFSFLQLSQRRAVGNVAIKDNEIEIEAPVKQTFSGMLQVL
jgi:predicted PhzF superfamily epimerase YddE/YHI9